MSLSLKSNNTPLKVVSYIDSAVTCDRDTYTTYLQNLDESLLGLNSEPTRFILKRSFSVAEHQAIKSAQASIKGKDVQINLGYVLLEVKYALVDIEGGADGFGMLKDSNGYAQDSLISLLEESGILMDLFTARQAAVGQVRKDPKKN